MITRLDGASARKISAGQVITDLPSVVKELLENALDAGAGSVTVRLQRFGLDKIVVDDDGSGIPMPGVVSRSDGSLLADASTPLLRNRATTKHVGSELRGETTAPAAASSQPGPDENNEDGDDDPSLGFRGEALHSLAQLSRVTVETMHASCVPYAVLVSYDSAAHKVQLAVTSSRQATGTTVTVTDLFRHLPVRLKEFTKSQRKQLLNAANLVKQYAVSHPRLRIVMSHQESAQSAVTTLVSLTGSNDLQRSVTEAYGGLCLSHMTRVEWLCSFGSVTGFVSKVGSGGGGRLSSDRQVFSLDSRIVDLPRIAAAINDAFGQCLPNAHQRQSVAFFLRIQMRDTVGYDVNLTPNKRKVLLASEEKLAEEIHTVALTEFRAATEGIDMERQSQSQQPRQLAQPPPYQQPAQLPFLGGVSNSNASNNSSVSGRGSVGFGVCGNTDPSKEVLRPVAASAFTQYTFRRSGEGEEMGSSAPSPGGQPAMELHRLGGALYNTDAVGSEETPATGGPLTDDEVLLCSDSSSPSTSSSCSSSLSSPRRGSREEEETEGRYEAKRLSTGSGGGGDGGGGPCDLSGSSDTGSDAAAAEEGQGHPRRRQRTEDEHPGSGGDAVAPEQLAVVVVLSDEGNQQREAGAHMHVAFPEWAQLTVLPSQTCCYNCLSAAHEQQGTQDVTGHAPHFSSFLEQTGNELTTYFHKRSFKDMVVLGQFNHGFIIASLGSDLFVIDQHASDEKYNYERLLRAYTARPQPLVQPIPVPMDAEEVELAVAHAPELLNHGFRVDRGSDPTKLLVLSVPVLPYDVVGAADVLELVQQLVRYGTITKQLRAVWHSLATKACRTSIMIGTALPESTMRTIVERLSELDQPWTCPHGRPTLRHLGNRNAFQMGPASSSFSATFPPQS